MEQSERQWGAFESVLRFMMHNRKKDSSLPNDLEITDKSVRFHDLIEFNCTITSGFTIEDVLIWDSAQGQAPAFFPPETKVITTK